MTNLNFVQSQATDLFEQLHDIRATIENEANHDLFHAFLGDLGYLTYETKVNDRKFRIREVLKQNQANFITFQHHMNFAELAVFVNFVTLLHNYSVSK